MKIGAVSANVTDEERNKLREFGDNLGMAFQIRDDLLDYVGKKSITGKQIGKDMAEKKLTLPLIHALENAPHSEAMVILRIVKKGAKKKELDTILKFTEDYGGIKYSEQKAKQYAELARKNISEFPDSPSKTSLNDFVTFVIERDK
jgi:octaprenyl-diphosphate synthase